MVKKYLFALTLSAALCSTCPVDAMMKDIEFNSTGNSIKFDKSPHRLVIETDNNNFASYQGENQRYPVRSGQRLNVEYDIEVEDGIMSLGALNTNRNGWYASEDNATAEIIREQGRHQETIKWLVPENDTETSLVLRNYHLGTPGESKFTVHSVKMAIEDSKVVPHKLKIDARELEDDAMKAEEEAKNARQKADDLKGKPGAKAAREAAERLENEAKKRRKIANDAKSNSK